MELSPRKIQVLETLLEHPGIGISEILEKLPAETTIPTLNRDLKALVVDQLLT